MVAKFRGKYTPEFRDTAVREMTDKSRPIVDVARELGMVAQTLRNWVAAHRERRRPDRGRPTRSLLADDLIENININGCDEVWVTYADERGKVRVSPVSRRRAAGADNFGAGEAQGAGEGSP